MIGVTKFTILLAVSALCWPALLRAAEHDQEEWLIVPKDYTPEKSWPLILASQNQIAVKAMENFPCFAAYGPSEALVAPLLEMARKYNIDPYRIYATGFSRSGHGLLETAWQYPDRFAAIAPVCEDMRWKEQYKRQKIDLLRYIQQTPTLLLHGDHDSFLASGRKNYELMKAAGCPVEFGTFPGGHGPDPIYFHDITRITRFFDQHALNPYPKVVDHVVYTYSATRAFWVDCQVAKGSIEHVYPVLKVQVKDGNRIEVTANEGVRKLTFFLNDKLVDMAPTASVAFQGKEIYHGPVQPQLTVTLREGEVCLWSSRRRCGSSWRPSVRNPTRPAQWTGCTSRCRRRFATLGWARPSPAKSAWISACGPPTVRRRRKSYRPPRSSWT